MRCLMIDVAQTSMAAGAACAIAQVTGVNDNMSQSHYHDYFELYFLDSGERYHLMDEALQASGRGLYSLPAADNAPFLRRPGYGFFAGGAVFPPGNHHLSGASS